MPIRSPNPQVSWNGKDQSHMYQYSMTPADYLDGLVTRAQQAFETALDGNFIDTIVRERSYKKIQKVCAKLTQKTQPPLVSDDRFVILKTDYQLHMNHAIEIGMIAASRALRSQKKINHNQAKTEQAKEIRDRESQQVSQQAQNAYDGTLPVVQGNYGAILDEDKLDDAVELGHAILPPPPPPPPPVPVAPPSPPAPVPVVPPVKAPPPVVQPAVKAKKSKKNAKSKKEKKSKQSSGASKKKGSAKPAALAQKGAGMAVSAIMNSPMGKAAQDVAGFAKHPTLAGGVKAATAVLTSVFPMAAAAQKTAQFAQHPSLSNGIAAAKSIISCSPMGKMGVMAAGILQKNPMVKKLFKKIKFGKKH